MKTWGSGSSELALRVKAEEMGKSKLKHSGSALRKLHSSLTFILTRYQLLIAGRDLQGYE